MKVECLGSGSKGNCYILTFENGKIIILEAGVPYREIKKELGYRLLDVEFVLVTHEHMDHSRACLDMLKDGLTVMASQGTLNALGLLEIPRAKIFKNIHNDYFMINSYEAHHDAEEPLMFTVYDKKTKDSLVFITDSAYTDFVFNKFNYYLVESNYIKSYLTETLDKGIYSNPQGHMSLENNIEMFKKTDLSKCEQIILVHISETNGNPQYMVEKLKEVTNCKVDYAKKGKEWNLSKTPF